MAEFLAGRWHFLDRCRAGLRRQDLRFRRGSARHQPDPRDEVSRRHDGAARVDEIAHAIEFVEARLQDLEDPLVELRSTSIHLVEQRLHLVAEVAHRSNASHPGTALDGVQCALQFHDALAASAVGTQCTEGAVGRLEQLGRLLAEDRGDVRIVVGWRDGLDGGDTFLFRGLLRRHRLAPGSLGPRHFADHRRQPQLLAGHLLFRGWRAGLFFGRFPGRRGGRRLFLRLARLRLDSRRLRGVAEVRNLAPDGLFVFPRRQQLVVAGPGLRAQPARLDRDLGDEVIDLEGRLGRHFLGRDVGSLRLHRRFRRRGRLCLAMRDGLLQRQVERCQPADDVLQAGRRLDHAGPALDDVLEGCDRVGQRAESRVIEGMVGIEQAPQPSMQRIRETDALLGLGRARGATQRVAGTVEVVGHIVRARRDPRPAQEVAEDLEVRLHFLAEDVLQRRIHGRVRPAGKDRFQVHRRFFRTSVLRHVPFQFLQLLELRPTRPAPPRPPRPRGAPRRLPAARRGPAPSRPPPVPRRGHRPAARSPACVPSLPRRASPPSASARSPAPLPWPAPAPPAIPRRRRVHARLRPVGPCRAGAPRGAPPRPPSPAASKPRPAAPRSSRESARACRR